jgi:hypothetical protein
MFWSRMLGLLIAFAIVAVLVAGGVKNLTGELSAAYEALAASQYELGKTQNALDYARTKWTATESQLAIASTEVDRMGRKLEASQQQLEAANSVGQALVRERDELKRGLRDAVYVISEADRELKARNAALQAAKAELRDAEAALERQLSLPQYSMIVTTERVMEASYYERFAAAKVSMFVESDSGVLFYDGKEMLHEIEEYVAYAERTQVVLTTTAPGQDVLECLEDAERRRRRGRRGCGEIVPVQASAMHMEAYAYQSQYSSMQSLLWME